VSFLNWISGLPLQLLFPFQGCLPSLSSHIKPHTKLPIAGPKQASLHRKKSILLLTGHVNFLGRTCIIVSHKTREKKIVTREEIESGSHEYVSRKNICKRLKKSRELFFFHLNNICVILLHLKIKIKIKIKFLKMTPKKGVSLCT
jgi:hypothetical protein